MLPLPLPKWDLQEGKLLVASGIFPAASPEIRAAPAATATGPTQNYTPSKGKRSIIPLFAEAGIFIGAAAESDILNAQHFSGICVPDSPLTGFPCVPAAASSQPFISLGNYHTISTTSL